jgi:hypothetical protein
MPYRRVNHGTERTTTVTAIRPLSWRRHALPARTHPANMPDKEEIWTAMSASQPPSSVRFEHVQRWGITMPLATDSPSILGDVPGPDPARAPPNKASPGRGSLVGGSRRGSPCQARSAMRSAAAPRAGVPGPRLVHMPSEPSGSLRFSGTSFAQVAAATLGKRARGLNPDKDEAGGSSPPRPTARLPQRKR